jgi:glycosyltransferase involved in cell wall biosynthesis
MLLNAFSGELPGSWVLHLAGPIASDLRAQAEAMFRRPNVIAHNAMRREDLAALMVECDVLVFPSFAEGSARVVFEAMACGCAVVTTPNAGSVVRHGEHGWIIQPGDAISLRSALVDAMNRRDFVAAAGASGARLVEASYRQQHYSEHLLVVYSKLLAQILGTRSVDAWTQ